MRTNDANKDSRPQPPTRRQRVLFGARIAISIVALGFLLRAVDVDQLLTIGARLSPTVALAAMLLLIVQVVILGERWHLLSRSFSIPSRRSEALKLTWSGIFLSTLLPGSFGGDVYRAWALRQAGADWKTSIGAAVGDRLLALAALVLLVGSALPFLTRSKDLGQLSLFAAVASLAIAVILLSLALWCSVDGALPASLRAWLPKCPAFPWNRIGWRFFILVLGYSIAAHCLTILAVFIVATDLSPALSIQEAFGLVPAVILLTIIPVSWGGWGVREVAMVGMLGIVNIPPIEALSISVAWGIGVLLIGLPGILFLARSKTSRQDEATQVP